MLSNGEQCCPLQVLRANSLPTKSSCLQDGSAVTAVAFTPGSQSVAVANAANEVVVFDVALLQHTKWSMQNAAWLPARLLHMPGRIMHISFCPDPSVRPHWR